jgi:hypothetical protein
MFLTWKTQFSQSLACEHSTIIFNVFGGIKEIAKNSKE